MKPRISIHLSEHTAARLASAAGRPGATRSAIVEAALDRFLDDGEADDAGSVTQLLGSLTRQLESLSCEVRAVKEIVALHSRFDLAMAPTLPAEAQSHACQRGLARFNEFVTQVQRRVLSGTSLLQETVDRLGATDHNATKSGSGAVVSGTAASLYGFDPRTPDHDINIPRLPAAVREDGSKINFRK